MLWMLLVVVIVALLPWRVRQSRFQNILHTRELDNCTVIFSVVDDMHRNLEGPARDSELSIDVSIKHDIGLTITVSLYGSTHAPFTMTIVTRCQSYQWQRLGFDVRDLVHTAARSPSHLASLWPRSHLASTRSQLHQGSGATRTGFVRRLPPNHVRIVARAEAPTALSIAPLWGTFGYAPRTRFWNSRLRPTTCKSASASYPKAFITPGLAPASISDAAAK